MFASQRWQGQGHSVWPPWHGVAFVRSIASFSNNEIAR